MGQCKAQPRVRSRPGPAGEGRAFGGAGRERRPRFITGGAGPKSKPLLHPRSPWPAPFASSSPAPSTMSPRGVLTFTRAGHADFFDRSSRSAWNFARLSLRQVVRGQSRRATPLSFGRSGSRSDGLAPQCVRTRHWSCSTRRGAVLARPARHPGESLRPIDRPRGQQPRRTCEVGDRRMRAFVLARHLAQGKHPRLVVLPDRVPVDLSPARADLCHLHSLARHRSSAAAACRAAYAAASPRASKTCAAAWGAASPAPSFMRMNALVV